MKTVTVIIVLIIALMMNWVIERVRKDAIEKTNNAWIIELSRRNIVTPNMEGSFTWNDESNSK